MRACWKLILTLLVIDGFHTLFGQINVPEYMPLNIGNIYSYDDSSEATFTNIETLELTGITAYVRVWTENPNIDIAGAGNVKDYYLELNEKY